MKVLFIYPDVGTMLPPDYQHGVGTLLAVLKKSGHTPKLIYVHDELSREELIEKTSSFGPGLVAISTVSNQYHRSKMYAEWLKEKFDTPIVIGGMHATLAPEEVIKENCFDILCVGEGEGAIVELADAIENGQDISTILNLWVKKDNKVIKNEVRPLTEDLDALPFVDRETFHFDKILKAQDGKCSMLSGRGCPFGCTYCANEGIRSLYKGKGNYVRMRSVEHVLSEMREILKNYNVTKWEFNDDIFTLKRKWMEEFCELYGAEFNIPFDVNVRVETVDRQALAILKNAGCDLIRIGVESGSERVRKLLMKRNMTNAQIERVFEDAESVGLKTWSFNMVGLPGETRQDADETIRLNEKLCPDHMQVSVFNPYPGTKLYDKCIEDGLLSGRTVDGYFLPDSVLVQPEFPAQEINAAHQRLIRLRDQCTTKKRILRELNGKLPYFDFVEKLDEAKIETPGPQFVGEDYFWIGEDARRVLRAHPPAKISYKVKVPKNAVLKFSLAMHPQVLDRGKGGGVIFSVFAGRFKKRMKQLFEKTLNPKDVLSDCGWHDVEIGLDSFAGKNIHIEFVTCAVDYENPDHNTVGFGYPMVLEVS